MARGGAKYGRGAGVAAIRNLGEYKAKRARAATRTRAIKGAIDTGAAVATTAIGAMGKAETAWGEYEAGYKELGGDVANIEKPGFFKRTAQQILPGGRTGLPEGDVTIGKKVYDRAQIQEAGSFLGSDAAAILDEGTRKQYLERTAPGRTEATTFTSGLKLGQSGGIDPTMDYTGVDPQKYDALVRSRQGGGVGAKFQGTEFGQGTGGVQGPDFLTGYQPKLQTAGDTITEADRVQTGRIQMEQKQAGWGSYGKARKQLDIDIRKDEEAAELTSMRKESKERLSQPSAAPTFSPEFLQGQQDYLQSSPYKAWEEDQSIKGINKARQDELERQFYEQNPRRNLLETQKLSSQKHNTPINYEQGSQTSGFSSSYENLPDWMKNK